MLHSADHLSYLTIDQLAILLADEGAAVASYDRAIMGMQDPPLWEFGENSACHRQRHALLAETLKTHHEETTTLPTPAWRLLDTPYEGSTTPLPARDVIDVLLEGEDRLVAHYLTAVHQVDATMRTLLETDLIPRQASTRGRISLLSMSGTPPDKLPP